MTLAGATKSLVDVVPSERIEIAAKIADTIPKGCEKELSELAYSKRRVEWDWTSRSEIVSESGVVCQDSSKNEP